MSETPAYQQYVLAAGPLDGIAAQIITNTIVVPFRLAQQVVQRIR